MARLVDVVGSHVEAHCRRAAAHGTAPAPDLESIQVQICGVAGDTCYDTGCCSGSCQQGACQ